MIIRPTAPYRHDGQTLHPKLTYLLPAGMAAFLVAHGLAVEVASDEPADIDLAHLSWDAGTTLYQGGAALTPNSP